MKLYKYYQPNEKDLKDEVGDCSIRAFTKAMNKSWLEVFDELVPYARKHQCLVNQKPAYEEYLFDMGWVYRSTGRISKSYTVDVFAMQRPKGTFIVYVKSGFRTHLVCVKDGIYYDTWDCGDQCVYGFYENVYERKGD